MIKKPNINLSRVLTCAKLSKVLRHTVLFSNTDTVTTQVVEKTEVSLLIISILCKIPIEMF